MSNFTFTKKKISSIYTATSNKSYDLKELSKNINISDQEILKHQNTTGIESVFRGEYLTTSDYSVRAAECLIKDNNIDVNEIKALIFVTQTPDFIIPKTSSIIQDRLKLKNDIFVLDINDGCSGYIYGLITSLQFCSKNVDKILLLSGDTPSKQINSKDKSSNLLFGDGASATLIEYDENCNDDIYLSQGIDGSGYQSICINDGGYRNPINKKSFDEFSDEKGNIRSKLNLNMKGDNVFLFGISRVPKQLKNFINDFNIDINNIDFFVMHQANMMMNKMIAKKLKIEENKTLYSLKKFGNTSSLSIPLTIVVNKDKFKNKVSSFLLSGFSVGLSWGNAFIKISNDTNLKHIYINE